MVKFSICAFLTIIFSTLIPVDNSNAQDINPPDQGDVGGAEPDNPVGGGSGGVDETRYEDTIYYDLCQIRRMFCGSGALAIIGAGVFAVGLTFFMGRTSWTTVMVFVAGALIFISAEQLAQQFLTPPGGSEILTLCSCIFSF